MDAERFDFDNGTYVEMRVAEVYGQTVLDIYLDDRQGDPQRLVINKDEGIVLMEWLSRATA